MTRYRWLQVEWPFSIRALAKRIKTFSFGEDIPHGFVIDRVRDDYLEARYIERVEYTDTVLDPFGKELSFERVEFRQCVFRASADAPGLEVLNAPRSVQSLLNRLAEASDFSLTVAPFHVDVLAWAEALQRISSMESIVDSLQLGSLQLEQGITAKAIIKGDQDVRKACAKLANERKFNLEKMQLRLQGHFHGSIVLSNVGAAKVDVDDPTYAVLAALRQSLAEVTGDRGNGSA